MRKVLVVLIFLAVPLAAENTPKATLADMSWLTGHWTGTALGGFVEEISYHFEGMIFYPTADTLKVVLSIGQKDGSVREETFTYTRVK